MFNFYARVTGWLGSPQVARRSALLAFVCALPSLAMGLGSDDFILHRNLRDYGRLEAYTFFPRDEAAAHGKLIEQRNGGGMAWWADEHPRTSYFRPLSSFSLWLDFDNAMPAWWMHLQNSVIYALMVWLVVSLYKQLGLSDAALPVAALFFALDGGIATSVGWLAARNTLLAPCFGFACLLLHDRAQRPGRPAWLALAVVCFLLSLLSGELGLCTLGYLLAHALFVDRSSRLRRVLAMLPYGLVTALYLYHYLLEGYGNGGAGMAQDAARSPLFALLTWLESIPIWLATTATLPIASVQLLVTDFHLPLMAFSIAVLALLVPWLGKRAIREPPGRMLLVGAVLSLVPLAATLPQERLRFFASFGVYGVLGTWVAHDFDAPARLQRTAARAIWRLHGVLLPLTFVPCLFSIANGPGVAGAIALDRALPQAQQPVAILLNAPAWPVPWYQVAMRVYRGEVDPPVYALYAGSQAIDIKRVDERSLELQVTRSWFAAPFESLRNLERSPFHPGDHITLPDFDVEVREVNAAGAPARARFTFQQPLEDPTLAFRCWQGADIVTWEPPAVGATTQLAAAAAM